MTLGSEDAKARAGAEGGGKEGRKAVTSGWKVIVDWLCFTCVLLGPPHPLFLQHVLDS